MDGDVDDILKALGIFLGVILALVVGAMVIGNLVLDDTPTMTHQEMCEQKIHGRYEKKEQVKAQHDNICWIDDFPMNMDGINLPESKQ